MSYIGQTVELEKFAFSAKGFTGSPLGIIALFIVLVYGFASLVVGLGGHTEHVVPLIYFLVIFPVIVFFGFLWLVAKHHNKLYGPSDFKNEENYLKAQMSSVASLAAAAASRQPGYDDGYNSSQLQDIVDVVAQSIRKPKLEKWKNRVLWVDDIPSNNTYERQAFEAQGIEFDIALSTDEALDKLSKNKYAAIISDMGRKEGPQEGYILLDNLRSINNLTPFIIYSGSNLPEHKKMAREKGAVGATNRAEELYQLVMGAVSNGS